MGYFTASFSNLVNMVASPANAFQSLRERPIVTFPVVLVVLAWAVMWIWYYGAVDFAWMKSHVIGLETLNASAQEREAVSKSIGEMKPGAFVVLSIIGVSVVMLGLSLVMALYFLIMDAVLDDKLGFRHWMSLVLWTTVPALFTVLAMVVNFLLADSGRIGPDQLNPVTLNNLVFHAGPDNPFRRMLDLDLMTLWSWGLMVIGYRAWTKRSWASSIAIVLAPMVAIYAIWAGVILLRMPG